MILTPLQKLQNNVVDLGKIIVATGFEWLPKVQKIAKSGHTAHCATSIMEQIKMNIPICCQTQLEKTFDVI